MELGFEMRGHGNRYEEFTLPVSELTEEMINL